MNILLLLHFSSCSRISPNMSPSKHHTFAIFQELKSVWISSSTAPFLFLQCSQYIFLLISYLQKKIDSPETPIHAAHMNIGGVIYYIISIFQCQYLLAFTANSTSARLSPTRLEFPPDFMWCWFYAHSHCCCMFMNTVVMPCTQEAIWHPSCYSSILTFFVFFLLKYYLIIVAGVIQLNCVELITHSHFISGLDQLWISALKELFRMVFDENVNLGKWHLESKLPAWQTIVGSPPMAYHLHKCALK